MADPTRRWGPEDDERLRALHAEQVSLREAGRRMGWTVGTVVNHAKLLNLPWHRSETDHAAEARRADGRRRRAEIVDGLHSDIQRLQAELFAPTTVFNFGGKDNVYREQTIPAPTHADKLKILQAIANAGQTIERFQKIDSDSGVTEAVGMLDTIWEAIKATAYTPEMLTDMGVEGSDLL